MVWGCRGGGGSGGVFFSPPGGGGPPGPALAGWIYEWTGTYTIAFVSAAALGLVAAGLALAIREEPVAPRRTPVAAPA